MPIGTNVNTILLCCRANGRVRQWLYRRRLGSQYSLDIKKDVSQDPTFVLRNIWTAPNEQHSFDVEFDF